MSVDHAPEPTRSRAWWRFAPLIGFAALGVVFAYMLFNNSGGVLPSTLLEKPSPRFSLSVLARGSDAPGGGAAAFTDADLRQGEVSIVNLWGSYCAPCRVEHPQLMALSQRSDLKVYGIAVRDEAEAARRFLRQLGDPFTLVGMDDDGQARLRWGGEGVPETFVLDGQGVVLLKHTGAISPQILREKIEPAIERAKRRGAVGG